MSGDVFYANLGRLLRAFLAAEAARWGCDPEAEATLQPITFLPEGCNFSCGPDQQPADHPICEWNAPIVAYDFTIPGRMKGGSTLRDIYRTLSAGIGGTPMPSYADSLDEQERWGLGYYTLSLARKPAAAPVAQEITTIPSHFVEGILPTDPSVTLWQQAKASRDPNANPLAATTGGRPDPRGVLP